MPCYQTCSNSGNKQNNNFLSYRSGFKFHPYGKSHSNNCVFDCLATNTDSGGRGPASLPKKGLWELPEPYRNFYN